MKFSILFSAVFCAVSLAAPTPTPEWSYTKAFDYALSMGGPLEDNIVAQVIKRHVERNNLEWGSDYSDITTDEGAVLNLAPELRGRSALPVKPHISQSDSQMMKRTLQARQNIIIVQVNAHPWTNNCSGTGFFWDNLGFNGCVTYTVNGQRLRMYSMDDATCGGSVTASAAAHRNAYCYASHDGRGWMSFKTILAA